MVYGWKVDGIVKVDAAIVGAICAELDNSEAGLTPATLLEQARNEQHPLHGCFEWDDTIAAEKYRLTQARSIIVNLTVEDDNSENPNETKIRAFVNVDRGTTAYRDVIATINRDDEREKLLRRAKQELEWFTIKYRRLSELQPVFDEIKKLA